MPRRIHDLGDGQGVQFFQLSAAQRRRESFAHDFATRLIFQAPESPPTKNTFRGEAIFRVPSDCGQ